jgi:hypothetical protein
MVTQSFIFDETEILTQAAEAAAGLGSFISGLQNIELSRKYYNLYNQQRQFYYSTFQSGAERTLANQAYSEPTYVLNYGARAQTVLNPSTGPLATEATDVLSWVTRHGGMFAQTIDPDISELEVDMARITSDWINYLYRFEELWADIRNDTRWAHRLTVHNIAIKQGTAITASLSDAVKNYSSQITDLSSQLATYGNGIAKYAGYKRGLQDTAQEFTQGTKFSRQPVMTQLPAKNMGPDLERARSMA